MSDIFQQDGARTTRKVSQVPGGASSISFGEGSAPPATPTKPVTAVDIGVEVAAPAAAPEAPAASAPASEEALEALKLKVGQVCKLLMNIILNIVCCNLALAVQLSK